MRRTKGIHSGLRRFLVAMTWATCVPILLIGLLLVHAVIRWNTPVHLVKPDSHLITWNDQWLRADLEVEAIEEEILTNIPIGSSREEVMGYLRENLSKVRPEKPRQFVAADGTVFENYIAQKVWYEGSFPGGWDLVKLYFLFDSEDRLGDVKLWIEREWA